MPRNGMPRQKILYVDASAVCAESTFSCVRSSRATRKKMRWFI